MSTKRRPTKTLQFSCKQCSHTDSTQEAIAVHYLQKHMEIDFCSLSQPVDMSKNDRLQEVNKQSPQRTENAINDDAKLEGVKKNKSTLNKKRVPVKLTADNVRKNTRSSTKTCGPDETSVVGEKGEISSSTSGQQKGRKAQKREAEIDSHARNDTENELGRGKRRKSTTKRFIAEDGSQNRSNEPMLDLPKKTNIRKETAQGTKSNPKSKDAIEENPEKETALSKRTRRQQTVARNSDGQLVPLTVGDVSVINTRSTSPTVDKHTCRMSRSCRRYVDDKSEEKVNEKEETKEVKTDTLSKKIERLPIPYLQFKRKLEQMITEWNSAQEQKKKDNILKCTFEKCSLTMAEDEWRVHESCHAKSMDGLKCPHCSFMCLHWRHMRKHLRKKHDLWKDRVFQCDRPHCNRKFIRFNQLRRHVMDKHFKGPLADRLLDGAYDPKEFEFVKSDTQDVVPLESSKRQRSQNLQSDGGSSRQRKIMIGKSEDRETAEDHRHKVTFVCELCLSKFRDEATMESHKKEHLVDREDIFLCLECGYGFSGGDALKDHYKEEHRRKLMRYQCQECPFATDKFYQMSSHHAVHNGKKEVMCDQCGKWLANQYNLKVHEFRKHSKEEEKTVTCPACPYRCADKSILRDHIKQHHKSMTKNPIYHRCPHCEYVGHKLKSLEFHMRIHTEQRRFKCHLCTYASKTKNHLKIHLQGHEGFKTAGCPDCDFKGASKKRLSEHMMSRHLEVEPYLCKICGWRTSYSGNMWKHINHHKKKLGDSMPDEPATVELELLKGVKLPEMPKAPTGKTRRKAGDGIMNAIEMNGKQEVTVGLYMQEVSAEQGAASVNELQVLQISGGGDDRNIVQENVIFISQESVGNANESEKTVEVLGVGEDGSIFTSTMNRDVEVAVLALARLEPGSHTREPLAIAEDGGQITILQGASMNQMGAKGESPRPAVADSIRDETSDETGATSEQFSSDNKSPSHVNSDGIIVQTASIADEDLAKSSEDSGSSGYALPHNVGLHDQSHQGEVPLKVADQVTITNACTD